MRTMPLSSHITFVVVLCVFSLVACDDSAPKTGKKPSSVLTINDPTEAEEASEALVLDLIPEVREQSRPIRFHYSAKGRRDPFQSIVNLRGSRKKHQIFRSLPPLQRKDISDLNLIGIIWGSLNPRAIITTANGKGYTVHLGTRIGINRGIIRKITQNEVVVEETLSNIFGEPRKSDVVMVLHSEKERVE